jgi:hypothetical protein
MKNERGQGPMPLASLARIPTERGSSLTLSSPKLINETDTVEQLE